MQITDEDRGYWAFQPIDMAAAKTQNIDQHIAAGWKKKGLTPASPADRRTRLRRATFDLTGLPPTPDEIAAFLADKQPGAWQRVIDRLLASPRYGERWARHWLDVARFAESHGFEHDYDRPYAFHYRDFVIKALNEDMPYSQFVKWQLAGDEYAPNDPQAMLATGFLGAGVYPTQITVSEAERVRYDAMDDMLHTAGQAVLGLTFGCARCHDHKYDPIPTRDYYNMLSAFTTTVRSEIDLAITTEPELIALQEAHDQKLADTTADRDTYLREQLPTAFAAWRKSRSAEDEAKAGQSGTEPAPVWQAPEMVELSAKHGTTFTLLDDGSYRAGGANPKHEQYTVVLRSPRPSTAFKLEALADKGLVRNGPGRASNGNFGLTELKASIKQNNKWVPVKLTDPASSFDQRSLGIKKAIDGKTDGCWAVDPQFGKDHAGVFHFASEVASGTEIRFELVFQCNSQHAIGRPRFSLSDQPAPVPIGKPGDKVQRSAADELDAAIADGKSDKDLLVMFRAIDPAARKLDASVQQLAGSRPVGKMEKVMVCSEGSHIKPMRRHTQGKDFYTPTYVLNRGDSNQKQEEAKLEMLQVLNPTGKSWFEEPPPEAKTTWRRRALAEWMMDTDNGGGQLAARVMANRVWTWHMGRGIVDTPNDFGYQSALPSHPELLDHLATLLMENEWRLKPLHRAIMTSRVYQLGNIGNIGKDVPKGDVASSQNIDPDNVFYSRREPHRLEAEAIRDNLLAVSGQLDETMFGKGTLNEASRRRSIYFMVKRSNMMPMLQVFDWPDTLTSCEKRQVTTTSPQALFFINNPQVRTWSEAFAMRVEKAETPVDAAWELATGRLPSKAERSAADAFVAEAGLVEFCHALLSSNAVSFVE